MQKLDLTIRRGATVALPIRVESDHVTTVAVTDISQTTPVRITAPSHGMPDPWRAAVTCAKGMTQMNSPNYPPLDADLHRASVVDADTVEFNHVGAACWRPWTSGGYLAYYTPYDLTLFPFARMQVKTRVDGEVLATFSTGDGTLEIDAAISTVWLRLAPEVSAALEFAKGVFDIELVGGGGDVVAVCAATSTFTVLPEITTSDIT